VLVNSRWGVGCSVRLLIKIESCVSRDSWISFTSSKSTPDEGTQASLAPYPQRDRVSVADKEREREERDGRRRAQYNKCGDNTTVIHTNYSIYSVTTNDHDPTNRIHIPIL